ncbi:MAG TPA: YciI-like protein [Candidatus Angelobacter sp.]|nr:YciI-like protein [Candidatus Angelobacter sp.]
MHHILIYDVVDDYVERRMQFRAEHLELGRQFVERGELLMGGALADPVDQAIIIFRGDSPAAAEAFVKADPYVNNGLVKSWRIRKWTTVIGEE